MTTFSIYMPRNLLEALDGVRGEKSRSSFVRTCVEDRLAAGTGALPEVGSGPWNSEKVETVIEEVSQGGAKFERWPPPEPDE